MTERDWATAYLAQGRADLKAAELLQTSAPSVVAMLLQMVFEKLAKAAVLKSGTPLKDVKTNHRVFSKLVLTLKANRTLLTSVSDGDMDTWNAILDWVIELEDAHPVRPFDPTDPKGKKWLPVPCSGQLEYPWDITDAAGTPVAIQWPEQHLSIAQRIGDPACVELPRLLRFAAEFSSQHPTLFP